MAVGIVIAVATTQGCMTIHSANTPYPVDDESIVVGMTRAEVDEILDGASRATSFSDGMFVKYRYEDHESWRGRTALYFAMAGGALDFVMFPVEYMIQRSGQRWASAIYDADGLLVMFNAVDSGGDPRIEVGGSSEPLVVVRRHTFLDAVLGSGHTTR